MGRVLTKEVARIQERGGPAGRWKDVVETEIRLMGRGRAQWY